MTRSRAALLSVLTIGAVLLVLPFAASADSTVWTAALPGYLGDRSYGDSSIGDPLEYDMITNPIVTIQYHASAIDTDTGAPIPCDGSGIIASGHHVRFVFEPHTYTDIAWVSAGGGWDTPYGDWIAGAEKPAANMCSHLPQKDFVSTFTTFDVAGQVSGNAKYRGGQITGNIYASLVADPPAQNLNVTGSVTSCTTADSAGSKNCVAGAPGSINAVFNFAPTVGRWYGRNNTNLGCYTSNQAMQWRNYEGSSWWNADLSIPAQSIACQIRVGSAAGTPPATPTVTGAMSGSNSCVIGTPYTITMSSTDPDGDPIKYGVDWDGNGTVDQYVPSTGFVPSGTVQTASRTFALAGRKTVKVLVIDSTGLSSNWATFTFSCRGQAEFAGIASGAISKEDNAINAGAGAAASLSIRAIPSLVRPGETTHVFWSTTNMTTCAITSVADTAANGKGIWVGAFSSPTGAQTSPIRMQTTYTLACQDANGATLTKSATVNLVPLFNEL